MKDSDVPEFARHFNCALYAQHCATRSNQLHLNSAVHTCCARRNPLTTNTMPRFVDVTQGIWRRAMVIPFDVTVPPERQDTGLFDKLREELPGIFLWAMAGMVRLMKERRFSHAEACFRAHREEKRRALPIQAFLEDACTFGPGKRGVIHDIWLAYKKWCAENGLTKPKPLIPFSKDVRALRPELKDTRETLDYGERRRVVLGIALKPGHDYENGTSVDDGYQDRIWK